MLFQLIATFMIGVLGASLAFILYKVTRGRMPKVVIPFAAALGMITYNVWNEMTWANRTASQLPEHYKVVVNGDPVISPFSPWTYLYPRTDSFTVVNIKTIQPLPNSPGRVLAQVHRLARIEGAKKMSWIVDCNSGEMAQIVGTTTFDNAGLPDNVTFEAIAKDNAIGDVVCAKAGHASVRSPAGN
ncbi:MAG: hypothetical protein KDJ45_07615 [Hyphomicrobiaceae bacterium]|nr:hypothetical protein [Hyphomicrobiaceae bacterium]